MWWLTIYRNVSLLLSLTTILLEYYFTRVICCSYLLYDRFTMRIHSCQIGDYYAVDIHGDSLVSYVTVANILIMSQKESGTF